MAEPKFVPKKGQVDYTNVRYCPVVNTVVIYQDKILLVKRSDDLRLYPGFWNGVSGFLDDNKTIEEKVKQELSEELGVKSSDVDQIELGKVIIQDSEKYQKTWIVFPVKVSIKTDKVKLDWEASTHSWVNIKEVKKLNILPGFDQVLKQFYPQ